MLPTPLTVVQDLAVERNGAAVEIVNLGAAGPGRYGTSDGARPKPGNTEVFDIVTPWQTTTVQQIVGTPGSQLYAHGGRIGCDVLTGGQSSSLAPDTVAMVFSVHDPNDVVPSTWDAIIWTWQVVGDQVLIPQPPETIGPGLEPKPYSGMEYNGQRVDGSSVALAELVKLIQTAAP